MKISSLRRYLAGEDTRNLVVFAFFMIVAAEVSRALSIESVPISILWPPTGLMLGASLIYGWPILALCGPLLAAWLVLLQDQGLAASLAMTASQLAGVAGGMFYLRFCATNQTGMHKPIADRIVYLKAGGIAASISSGFGTLAVWSAWPNTTEFHVYDIFLIYWLLEILSILLFAPLGFFILKNPTRFFRNVLVDLHKPATAISLSCVVGLAFTIFMLPPVSDQIYLLALAFLVFPLLCWMVLAAHPASVTLALPVISFVFFAFMMLGLGSVTQLTTIDGVVQFVLLLAGSVLLLQIIAVITFSRNQLVETLQQQANTDFLSGLMNDRAFLAAIGQEIEQRRNRAVAAANNRDCASWLIYLEVLDFDHLEDLMGFRARRNMEALFSARLMGVVGPEFKPARLGNGVYSTVFEEADLHTLDDFLDTLYHAFDGEMFSVEQHQTRIRVSVGAVALDGALEDPNQYLSAATQAALMARDRLPRVQKIGDPKSITLNRLGLTQRLELLKDALSEDRLVLFAQPIQPLNDESTGLCYEILLRLRGSDGDYISPGVFLPVAEAYGFMKQIDQWVIRATLEALAANPEWLAATRKCSINLAGVSLSSNEIVEFIEHAFAASGVPPHKIGFEITETQQIARREEAESITQSLINMGCSVSLDDFGTGLATFDYLKSFSVDTLKIDGVFIKNIETDANDKQIVKAICDVARWMGLKTVAEFVENSSVVELLKELGVDYGQGYGLGRPAPLSDMFMELQDSLVPDTKKPLG